jgi:hypothetical protein
VQQCNTTVEVMENLPGNKFTLCIGRCEIKPVCRAVRRATRAAQNAVISPDDLKSETVA